MTLKEKIIKHLESKGSFSEDADLWMVDELIDNYELSKKTLKILKSEGTIIYYTTPRGDTVSKLNPALNAYQMLQRNIHQCASKLGINRSDRLKLKIIEAKTADDFDKAMNL